jgi:uncharacterized protein with PQ loop repeat
MPQSHKDHPHPSNLLLGYYRHTMESGPVCAAERSPPPESFIITCYVVSALVLVTFGALAVWLSAKMPQSTKDIGVSLTTQIGLSCCSLSINNYIYIYIYLDCVQPCTLAMYGGCLYKRSDHPLINSSAAMTDLHHGSQDAAVVPYGMVLLC